MWQAISSRDSPLALQGGIRSHPNYLAAGRANEDARHNRQDPGCISQTQVRTSVPVAGPRWWGRRRYYRICCRNLSTRNSVRPSADYTCGSSRFQCRGQDRCGPSVGKNLIGAFYQPRGVLIDPLTLRTLPRREWIAGLAEVIKYGIIADQEFFAFLEQEIPALLKLKEAPVTHVIKRSCEIKAQVVAADERESDRRRILNYGHTIGHALESLAGYRGLIHGEAVGVGLVQEADLACHMGLCGETLSNGSEVWCGGPGCQNRSQRSPLRPSGAPCNMTRRWLGGRSSGYGLYGSGRWLFDPSSSRSVPSGFREPRPWTRHQAAAVRQGFCSSKISCRKVNSYDDRTHSICGLASTGVA